MEVNQQQALELLGSQALELAVLRGQVNRFAQHQCVPTPCDRECCREPNPDSVPKAVDTE